MLHDSEFMRRLAGSTSSDYDAKTREWIVQELVMRDRQMARLAQEALDEIQTEKQWARKQVEAISAAARAWNLLLEARQRGRKTVRVSELMGD